MGVRAMAQTKILTTAGLGGGVSPFPYLVGLLLYSLTKISLRTKLLSIAYKFSYCSNKNKEAKL